MKQRAHNKKIHKTQKETIYRHTKTHNTRNTNKTITNDNNTITNAYTKKKQQTHNINTKQ